MFENDLDAALLFFFITMSRQSGGSGRKNLDLSTLDFREIGGSRTSNGRTFWSVLVVVDSVLLERYPGRKYRSYINLFFLLKQTCIHHRPIHKFTVINVHLLIHHMHRDTNFAFSSHLHLASHRTTPY
jgi:hypothetical protein